MKRFRGWHLGLLLALAGCGLTPQGDASRRTIALRGAVVADAALENAEWVICNAATIGSVMRRYGQDPDLSAAYSTLCVPSRAAVRELIQSGNQD